MSYELIRVALEGRLNDLMPFVSTAWENVNFVAPSSLHQRAFILPAGTSNPTYGDTLMRESGILQVSVCSPAGDGSSNAMARTELIRSWFPRGLSLVNGTVTVIIAGTPSIAPAIYEQKLYVLVVSIPYLCDVH
jgi:hypothetical protein